MKEQCHPFEVWSIIRYMGPSHWVVEHTPGHPKIIEEGQLAVPLEWKMRIGRHPGWFLTLLVDGDVCHSLSDCMKWSQLWEVVSQ
jgi:hypothetical protein